MSASYRNGFYRHLHGHDPAVYRTDAPAVHYRGFLLYNRIKGKPGQACWDVVKDGVCIGQYGGRAGCEALVDACLDTPEDFWAERAMAVLRRPTGDALEVA